MGSSRLLGSPLPENVSRLDLVLPVGSTGRPSAGGAYLLGGKPGVAKRPEKSSLASPVLESSVPTPRSSTLTETLTVLRKRSSACGRASPDLVLVAFGAPKQELLSIASRPYRLRPSRSESAAASTSSRARSNAPGVDVPAGHRVVVPSAAGAAAHAAARYLVEDPAFIAIVAQSRRGTRHTPSL